MVKTPKQISTNAYSFSENGFPMHFKELEEIVTETFPRSQKDNKYGLKPTAEKQKKENMNCNKA